MTEIIDMHTHMFPEDIMENWDKYAARDPYFKLLTDPKGSSIQRYATAEEALELADEAGVEKIVMQGWYWNDHELCKQHNDYMYRIIKKYPDRFEAFMSINPRFEELALEEVERNVKRGFKGIGELGPGANGYRLDDKCFIDLMEAAEGFDLPVNIHVNEPLGRDYPGKDPTGLNDFYKLVKKFPNLTLILAHLGGGLPFYEFIPEIKESFENVYYDLAANPLVYDTKVIRSVVDMVGADKILFGSDFPLLIYPRKSKEKGFTMFLDDIRENAGLDEEEWTKIMRANAEGILR